jgi:hypothetical protein
MDSLTNSLHASTQAVFELNTRESSPANSTKRHQKAMKTIVSSPQEARD